MKVLLLTDIHGDKEKLESILEAEEYEAVLCAGDIGDASEFDDYSGNLNEVLEKFDRQGKMVKAVPGNMDPEEECVSELIQHRMNIHKNMASFEEFDVVGFGGGKTPFGTPFEPKGSEIKTSLEQLYPRMKSETTVGVIHQPPANTELDEVEGDNVGSEEVRSLLEDLDFDLVLTGHIHESRGRENLNGTEVLNPGPVLEGFYAVCSIGGGGFNVEMKSL